MIRFACPNCGKVCNAAANMAGRVAKCPACGQQLQIPGNAPPIPAPAPPWGGQVPAPLQHQPPQTAYIDTHPNRPVAVQVNVQQSQAAHSLGIASLVLGILSFFVCWLPFVGLGFGGLGLAIGAVGLILAMARKGTGIGYSIAGTAVSSVAVLIGVVMMTGLFGAFSALEDAANKQPSFAGPAAASSTADEPSHDAAPNVEEPSHDAAPTAEEPSHDAAPTAEEAVWYGANQPLQHGNVRLEIADVTVGKVPLHREILDSDTVSEDDLLTIRVRITNISERKKIDYQGWMSDYASLADITAELTDDADNRYRKVNFGGLVKVTDTESNASIYPGKSITDAIVFELPVEGVAFLRLKLSGSGFGEDVECRFEIPASMIHRR